MTVLNVRRLTLQIQSLSPSSVRKIRSSDEKGEKEHIGELAQSIDFRKNLNLFGSSLGPWSLP